MIFAVPEHSHREALLVLCEGIKDANFISQNFNIKWKIEPLDNKKYILRKIVESDLKFPYIVIEGGKNELEGNLDLIVRQLRSIRKGSKVNVLALRDADSEEITTFEKIFSKVVNVIKSSVNNNLKFSPNLRPKLSPPQKLNKFAIKLLLSYKRGGSLEIFLFLIPKNLEYWMNESGNNLLKAEWYSTLNELLQNLIEKFFII